VVVVCLFVCLVSKQATSTLICFSLAKQKDFKIYHYPKMTHLSDSPYFPLHCSLFLWFLGYYR